MIEWVEELEKGLDKKVWEKIWDFIKELYNKILILSWLLYDKLHEYCRYWPGFHHHNLTNIL